MAHYNKILRELRALGASAQVAAQVAGNAKRWWHNSAMLLDMVPSIMAAPYAD